MKRDYHGRFVLGHVGYNKGKQLIQRVNMVCPICKKHLEITITSTQQYCSKRCAYKDRKKGKNSYHWKGGKTIHNGYVYIHKPKHPFAENKGYVFEHRLVMEKYLKRYLNKDEIIHHINHNKQDNNINNLMLLTRAQHIRLDGPKQCRK